MGYAKGRGMPNILVVYYLWQYPVRGTILSHLYSFKNYSKHRVCYLNIATIRQKPVVPSYVSKFQWDLIIFMDTALTPWSRPLFQKIIKSLEPLAENKAIKAACPQDEFVNMDIMNQFMRDMEISHIFTAVPESEWGKAYPLIDRSKTRLHQVLTGYLDDKVVSKVMRLAQYYSLRLIDIGYRANRHSPWLGRHAMLKWLVGKEFEYKAGARFITDISSEPSAILYGDDWWKFLLSCKYFLGTESGCSILDWDGSLKEKTEAYLKKYPYASFGEVEHDCFPRRDGAYRLRTLSPRHLECAVTRTCQILTEGDYNGILKPWVHYVPVKYNLSNIDEVLHILETLKDLGKHITDSAWQDLVQSGKYSYRTYIPWLLNTALEESKPFENSYKAEIIQKRMQIEDWCKWQAIKISLTKL